MRRHDFYTGFIKLILNVLMKERINICLPVGLFCISVKLVAYIKIVEAGLQHKWQGLPLNKFGGKCGTYESILYLAPWRIVADCYSGMHD